ncbi:MAG: hypothetical protein KBD37_00180 [Burkholderiales bacterium]|nr:hypothetical protein [Burkholderiales bacterium]
MNIDIIGCGSIGCALVRLIATYLSNTQIRVFDINIANLSELSYFSNVEIVYNNNYSSLTFNNTVICCASWEATKNIVKCICLQDNNIENCKTFISICRPNNDDLEDLTKIIADNQIEFIFAYGLEPGLTEILSYYLLNKVDSVHTLNIECGGLVLPKPNNLLGYKRLFGSSYLPFAQKSCFCIRNGKLITVPRFSEIKVHEEPDIGIVETWHDGMQIRLSTNPKLIKSNVNVDQRTIRWSGYANIVNLLQKAGMLDELPLNIDKNYSAKKLLESLSYESFTFKPAYEKSITILNFELTGLKDRDKINIKLKIKFFDLTPCINSMALATCLPILFLLLKNNHMLHGIIYPEHLFTQDNIKVLFEYMQIFGVKISEQTNVINYN